MAPTRKTARKATPAKRKARRKAAKPARRKRATRKERPLEEKLEALRTFVDIGDNLSETHRRTGVPISTLAGWLQDPVLAEQVASYRKTHARAILADNAEAARLAAKGVKEAIGASRLWIAAATRFRDGSLVEDLEEVLRRHAYFRDIPKHGRMLGALQASIDRMRRLDEGLPTEAVELTASDDLVDAELSRAMRDPEVVAELARTRPELLAKLRGEP